MKYLNLWRQYWPEITLWLLFAIASSLYLTHMPGLLGDEGSEGQDVFSLVNHNYISVVGQRSYIGPLLDYLRVPFFALFGYTTLALRLPIWLAMQFLAVMLWQLNRRWFGPATARFACVMALFSPIFLSYQRLGWAISLLPFFAVLTLWLSYSRRPNAPLLLGLAAGLGLHNHIIFLGSLLALILIGLLSQWRRPWRIFHFWPALLGFAAGFGTQAAVLFLMKEDQGDPVEVGQALSQRLASLPEAWPGLASGSSYIATFTGYGFAPMIGLVISVVLAVCVLAGLIFSKKRTIMAAWLLGLAAALAVLLFMVDHFALRYMIVPTLGLWFLAGVGLGETFNRFCHREWAQSIASIVLAVVLLAVYICFLLVPFLRTGGSANRFSLGPTFDSAIAFVDTKPLLGCLRGAGSVSSRNVHVYNRLLFYSHNFNDLEVTDPEKRACSKWLADYRLSPTATKPNELCPNLKYFTVTPNPKYNPKDNCGE